MSKHTDTTPAEQLADAVLHETTGLSVETLRRCREVARFELSRVCEQCGQALRSAPAPRCWTCRRGAP